MNGRRLGHYEIVRRLGSGGMGVVWEARDTRLDRLVAVKTLAAEATGDARARERLLQEARAAAALDHRNVCTVHDVGETEEGGLYVVMALYRGRSLKERIAAGPVPVEEALDLAAQAAEGLAAIHSRGILHRDVKPANLFVTEAGELKVLDFGLALAATTARLTASGFVIGTLAYMPPEQLRGEEIGPAADLWALGVTLFEMLTGQLPFPAANHGELVNAILNHPPASLSRMRPGLPDEVAELVERCLERDPGARASSAAELAASLKRLLGRPVSGPRAREGTGNTDKTVAFSHAEAARESNASSSAPAASGEAPKLKLYEHCARGRQLVQEMGLGGFERAREELSRALAIDPDYPSAHATLGMLHLMRHIAGADPSDLATGLSHLDTALARDPSLGDAWVWSCYGLARESRFAESEAAGRRAIELEPENPLAPYFLAVASWQAGVVAFETEGWDEAVALLARATDLAPGFEPAHSVAADLHMRFGRWTEAREAASAAVALEVSGEFELTRFVGGYAALGWAELRGGRVDEAEAAFEKGVLSTETDDHVYARAYCALARCGLGEVHLRRRRYDESLAAFRRAAEYALANPETLGMGWFAARAAIGMARCFRGLGMGREEREELSRARELVASKAGFDFRTVFLSGDGELRFELATFEASANHPGEAVRELAEAVRCGWRALPRLGSEPAWARLRARPEVLAALAPVVGPAG
jgi:tetratricopeptide (TPR) repeat protein